MDLPMAWIYVGIAAGCGNTNSSATMSASIALNASKPKNGESSAIAHQGLRAPVFGQLINRAVEQLQIANENKVAETKALITGEFSSQSCQLKNALGLSSEQIQKWSTEGVLYEKLCDRLSETEGDRQ